MLIVFVALLAINMVYSEQEDGSGEVSERSPLLASTPRDNRSIERTSTEGQQDDTSSVPIAEEPSTLRLVFIMGSVWIGVFIGALDGTIIATLSAPISESFNSFTLFSWLASSYLIANAALTPLSGKLTDIYGRRNGLIASNVFFLAGILICGFAKSESVMISGRVVSGIGGGCMMAISTFVASDLVPLRRRGVWQGIGNLCFGTGAGLGGVFGGWINDVWDWRWAFLIQVPFIIVSGLAVAFTVNVPIKVTENKSRIRRVDFLGASLLVVALVLLLLGLNSGGNIVPWNHPLVYVSMPLSGIFLLGFVYVELKVASEPVIPVRLLTDRTVAAGCLINWFSTMAYYAYLYYAPIYFQALGYSATQAGLRLVPSSIGAAFGSLGSGLIMRATGRYWLLNTVTQAIAVVACGLLVGIMGLNTPVWPPFVIFFFNGVAYGSMITISMIALISAVSHEHQAVITSASYAFRSTGSTIGITIASAVFQNRLQTRLWVELGDQPHAEKLIAKLRDSLAAISQLNGEVRLAALRAYMDALHSVWIVILILCILGTVCGLLMRENVLHSNLARK